MLRREFVRGVLCVSVAPGALLSQQEKGPPPPPPAPVPWTLGLNPNTPLPHTVVEDAVSEMDLHFFTPREMAALVRLSDVLMPQVGNKPGAVQAETPAFLDFLIGSSPAARRTVYQSGLKWLDGDAQKRFGKPFAELDEAQAGAVLKPWLRTWMNDHPPTEPHADFVNIAHDDIRTATMNSKAWSDAAAASAKGENDNGLYWFPIEPNLHAGSLTIGTPPHVLAAPRSEHSIPEYPR